MDDFFSQLKAAGSEGPSPTLLRQVRQVPGVRETGKHRYTLLPGTSLRFELVKGSWQAFVDRSGGRCQSFSLQNPVDERKLIDVLKRIIQGREDD